jgi:hypothetical protein
MLEKKQFSELENQKIQALFSLSGVRMCRIKSQVCKRTKEDKNWESLGWESNCERCFHGSYKETSKPVSLPHLPLGRTSTHLVGIKASTGWPVGGATVGYCDIRGEGHHSVFPDSP